MFHLANPQYLYALIIIPLLVIIFIFYLINRKSAMKRFGDLNIISGLMPLVSKRRIIFKFILLNLSLGLIIFAASRPQYGSKLREVKTKGVEIVIALDVSNSMMAQDIKPNRLEAAKRAIDRMLDNLKDDKIGLIVFAGTAFTQVPVTTDYSATKMMLSTVSPGLVQEQGTAIGDAIDLAMKSFNPNNDKRKVLIIITDGENHLDNPVEMATKAVEKGIIIYTIGIGDTGGSPIPLGNGSDFRKDKNGDVVISRLDEEMLINIAQAGNGKYIRANNSKFGLMTLYKEIENLEKSELESAIYSEYEDIYQYILFLALMLLLFDFVVLNRKNKQLEKMKLFNLRS